MRADTSPLLAHASPFAVVAYRRGEAIEARRFLAEAAHLARRLPAGRHMLNVCADRYRFTLGLAACLMTQRVSLLPSTHTPEVIRQLARFAPDVFCLTDEPACTIDLPRFQFPPLDSNYRNVAHGNFAHGNFAHGDFAHGNSAYDDAAFADAAFADVAYTDAAYTDAAYADTAYAGAAYADTASGDSAGGGWETPHIATDQLAAIVFTSGSTGTPLPHPKSWGKLARCVNAEATLLGVTDGAAHTFIGTVPPQHMYGFESSVLLALLSGNAFSAERPFYPADICATVAAVPRPRALISTPLQLRALLHAGIELPPLDLIVSATAPLSERLAQQVEAAFKARLLEIYGSTETGQIAIRRTTESATWRLWPDVRLVARGDEFLAQGGHIEQPTALCDVIEMTGGGEFVLHGRSADLVNVAGKRSSFGYLNAQLNAIPGVLDGAFFLPPTESDGAGTGTGVTRLAAVAVAPTLSAAQLTDRLRQRIDPVFLPRPLLMVERLPRNATGKLPTHALESLAARCAAATPPPQAPTASATAPRALDTDTAQTLSSELAVAGDHPAFAGHFPGFPVLPGAVLLDEALHEISRSRSLDLTRWRIAATKFLHPVRPGDGLMLEHSAPNEFTIRFVIRAAGRAVASGMLTAAAAAGSRGDGA